MLSAFTVLSIYIYLVIFFGACINAIYWFILSVWGKRHLAQLESTVLLPWSRFYARFVARADTAASFGGGFVYELNRQGTVQLNLWHDIP